MYTYVYSARRIIFTKEFPLPLCYTAHQPSRRSLPSITWAAQYSLPGTVTEEAGAYEKSLHWWGSGMKIFLSTFSSFLAKNIRWNRYLTSVMPPNSLSIFGAFCRLSVQSGRFQWICTLLLYRGPSGPRALSKICSAEIDFDIIDRLD